DRKTVIDDLMDSRFISEERFAEAYVRGKFNIKNWGRVKIGYGLRGHGISEELIEKSLDKISEKDYLNMLESVLRKKLPSDITLLTKEEIFTLKGKMYRYLSQKGYESDLVTKLLYKTFKE